MNRSKTLPTDDNCDAFSVSSIRSLVTIASSETNHSPNESPPASTLFQRRRRRCESSVSVLSLDNVHGIESNHRGNGTSISLIATCTTRKNFSSSSTPCLQGSNIALATICRSTASGDERGKLEVRMQYSSKPCIGDESHSKGTPSFTAVCLSNLPTFSPVLDSTYSKVVLLSIDSFGRLFASYISPRWDRRRNKCPLLDFNECEFALLDQDVNRNSVMKGKKQEILRSKLKSMNTLITTLDMPYNSDRSSDNTSDHISPHTGVCTSPKKPLSRKSGNTRKRKLSANKTEPLLEESRSQNEYGIYAVASCLKCHLRPKHIAPVVMYLTSTPNGLNPDNDPILRVSSFSTLSGLETIDVPMTSIAVVSRSICGGALWASLVAAGKNTSRISIDTKKSDGGLVLLGFQDGSVRVSFAYKENSTMNRKRKPTSILCTSRAFSLLKLDGEAILSLHLIRPPVVDCAEKISPFFLCVGEYGTVAVISPDANRCKDGKTGIILQSNLCNSRLVSIVPTEFKYCRSSSEHSLMLLGSYDSGRTYLHRIVIRFDDAILSSLNFDTRTKILVPLSCPATDLYCTPSAPMIDREKSSGRLFFALTHPSGKIVGIEMPSLSDQNIKFRRDVSSITYLNQGSNTMRANPQRHQCNALDGERTLENTLRKLDSAMKSSEERRIDGSSRIASSMTLTTAMNEIREVTRVSSYFITRRDHKEQLRLITYVSSVRPVVVQINITMPDFIIKMLNRWMSSAHVVHKCVKVQISYEELTPICYRVAFERQTMVVHGGSAISFVDTGINMNRNGSWNIEVPDEFVPYSVFVSLHTRYQYDFGSVTDLVQDAVVSALRPSAFRSSYGMNGVTLSLDVAACGQNYT